VDEEDAAPYERLGLGKALARFDAKEVIELVLPLAKQRLRNDQQDATFPLGQELSDDEPRLDRLPQADLVGKNAAAHRNSSQREDDGVDLVRVRVDSSATLRGSVALLLIGSTATDEFLGE
jgi:hypothetical protein